MPPESYSEQNPAADPNICPKPVKWVTVFSEPGPTKTCSEVFDIVEGET
jgi:hypothetical protein